MFGVSLFPLVPVHSPPQMRPPSPTGFWFVLLGFLSANTKVCVCVGGVSLLLTPNLTFYTCWSSFFNFITNPDDLVPALRVSHVTLHNSIPLGGSAAEHSAALPATRRCWTTSRQTDRQQGVCNLLPGQTDLCTSSHSFAHVFRIRS